MSVAQKWLFAFGTHKVLDMPVLAERCDHALLDGTSTGATNGNAHLVVAAKAVEFVLHFARFRSEFRTACETVEMIRMIRFALFD